MARRPAAPPPVRSAPAVISRPPANLQQQLLANRQAQQARVEAVRPQPAPVVARPAPAPIMRAPAAMVPPRPQPQPQPVARAQPRTVTPAPQPRPQPAPQPVSLPRQPATTAGRALGPTPLPPPQARPQPTPPGPVSLPRTPPTYGGGALTPPGPPNQGLPPPPPTYAGYELPDVKDFESSKVYRDFQDYEKQQRIMNRDRWAAVYQEAMGPGWTPQFGQPGTWEEYGIINVPSDFWQTPRAQVAEKAWRESKLPYGREGEGFYSWWKDKAAGSYPNAGSILDNDPMLERYTQYDRSRPDYREPIFAPAVMPPGGFIGGQPGPGQTPPLPPAMDMAGLTGAEREAQNARMLANPQLYGGQPMIGPNGQLPGYALPSAGIYGQIQPTTDYARATMTAPGPQVQPPQFTAQAAANPTADLMSQYLGIAQNIAGTMNR